MSKKRGEIEKSCWQSFMESIFGSSDKENTVAEDRSSAMKRMSVGLLDEQLGSGTSYSSPLRHEATDTPSGSANSLHAAPRTSRKPADHTTRVLFENPDAVSSSARSQNSLGPEVARGADSHSSSPEAVTSDAVAVSIVEVATNINEAAEIPAVHAALSSESVSSPDALVINVTPAVDETITASSAGASIAISDVPAGGAGGVAVLYTHVSAADAVSSAAETSDVEYILSLRSKEDVVEFLTSHPEVITKDTLESILDRALDTSNKMVFEAVIDFGSACEDTVKTEFAGAYFGILERLEKKSLKGSAKKYSKYFSDNLIVKFAFHSASEEFESATQENLLRFLAYNHHRIQGEFRDSESTSKIFKILTVLQLYGIINSSIVFGLVPDNQLEDITLGLISKCKLGDRVLENCVKSILTFNTDLSSKIAFFSLGVMDPYEIKLCFDNGADPEYIVKTKGGKNTSLFALAYSTYSANKTKPNVIECFKAIILSPKAREYFENLSEKYPYLNEELRRGKKIETIVRDHSLNDEQKRELEEAKSVLKRTTEFCQHLRDEEVYSPLLNCYIGDDRSAITAESAAGSVYSKHTHKTHHVDDSIFSPKGGAGSGGDAAASKPDGIASKGVRRHTSDLSKSILIDHSLIAEHPDDSAAAGGGGAGGAAAHGLEVSEGGAAAHETPLAGEDHPHI